MKLDRETIYRQVFINIRAQDQLRELLNLAAVGFASGVIVASVCGNGSLAWVLVAPTLVTWAVRIVRGRQLRKIAREIAEGRWLSVCEAPNIPTESGGGEGP